MLPFSHQIGDPKHTSDEFKTLLESACACIPDQGRHFQDSTLDVKIWPLY